jgi:hypothetical protein
MEIMIPYETLYIYEICVEIQGKRNFFKEDFIGCWNEQESSFLFFSQPHDEEVEALVDQRIQEQNWVTFVGLRGDSKI